MLGIWRPNEIVQHSATMAKAQLFRAQRRRTEAARRIGLDDAFSSDASSSLYIVFGAGLAIQHLYRIIVINKKKHAILVVGMLLRGSVRPGAAILDENQRHDALRSGRLCDIRWAAKLWNRVRFSNCVYPIMYWFTFIDLGTRNPQTWQFVRWTFRWLIRLIYESFCPFCILSRKWCVPNGQTMASAQSKWLILSLN